MPKNKATSSTRPSSDIVNSRSELSAMGAKIINYIRAAYPGLYLVSHEDQRVDAEMIEIAKELQYSLFFWSCVNGLIDRDKGQQVENTQDPMQALIAIQELKERSMVILKGFHLCLEDPNAILMILFKDMLQTAKMKNKTLIIVGCRLCLPPELERELTVVEYSLPDKDQLGQVLNGILVSSGIKQIEPELRDRVLDAAGGLTTIEAENAFRSEEHS